MYFTPACLWLALVAAEPSSTSTKTPSPSDLSAGGYSLYIALQALELAPDTYEAFEKDLGPPGESGYSMVQLSDHARRFGARTLSVQTSVENLRARPEPFTCITSIDPHHYVLLYDLNDQHAYIIDHPRQYKAGVDAFRNIWAGDALLIANGHLRSEESVTSLRRLRALIIPTLAGAFVLIVILAAVLYLRRGRNRSVASLLFVALTCLPMALAGSAPGSISLPISSIIVENGPPRGESHPDTEHVPGTESIDAIL